MDIFEEYIQKYRCDKNCRALTCKSYGKAYQEKYHNKFDAKKTNFELATYGDALLKFALCTILLDNVTQLSKTKQKFESDKFLIEHVAKHYDLLDYMNFDKEGTNKKHQDYIFYKKKNNNPTKYIATTVEAVLGALYKENYCNFNEICELVKSWMEL